MFKKIIFVTILKVNDENRRIRVRIRIRILIRSMDPRIRIHNKMSWIRNTGTNIGESEQLQYSIPQSRLFLLLKSFPVKGHQHKNFDIGILYVSFTCLSQRLRNEKKNVPSPIFAILYCKYKHSQHQENILSTWHANWYAEVLDALIRTKQFITSATISINTLQCLLNPQVGPYRKCCHVQTRAHGHVF
jgi:hypothetical protein